MNALLVYPEFLTTFWSWKHLLKFVAKKSAFPPLGLLTIAAMLPEFWEKRIVDLNVRKLTDADIKWADCVFMGAMKTQSDSAKEIIFRCATLGKSVILGGPILQTGYEEFEQVSHLLIGEAENILPDFLADLEKGSAKRIYESKKFPDICASPIPLWNLINPEDYASGLIQWSRGCPYGCEFCDIDSLNGRIPRVKSVFQFLTELDAMYQAGFRGAMLIADDNFIGNVSKIRRMLPKLAKWQKERGYPFSFTIEAPITVADRPELMEAMVEANVGKVFLGLETPNRASLAECAKTQNLNRDLVADVEKIQKSGLTPMSGFIAGFDNDSPATFADEMIDFIQNSGVVVAMVGVLQAPLGTKLYARLKREGRIREHASGNNTDCYPNFIPKMPVGTLVAGYKKIIERIYSPKEYYERICIFLKKYDPSKRVKTRIDKESAMAFLRSIWHIGILAEWKTKWYYWRTIFTVILKHRSAFSEAVAMQIYGAHFQKIAEAIKES